MKQKIYYHDTDCEGVVYYANYLKYLEAARYEYFIQKGLSLKDISAQGILFAIKKTNIEYKRPAHLGDTLDIDTKVVKKQNVSLFFYQEIKCDAVLLSICTTQVVCINKDFQPIAIPEAIISVL